MTACVCVCVRVLIVSQKFFIVISILKINSALSIKLTCFDPTSLINDHAFISIYKNFVKSINFACNLQANKLSVIFFYSCIFHCFTRRFIFTFLCKRGKKEKYFYIVIISYITKKLYLPKSTLIAMIGARKR